MRSPESPRWRAALAATLAAALAATAVGGDVAVAAIATTSTTTATAPATPPRLGTDRPMRAILLAALDAQRAVVDEAQAMVTDKLAARQRDHAIHLRAAYKAVRAAAPPLPGADAERLAVAWRRAAARRILTLDAAEVQQLQREHDDIAAAGRRITSEREAVATLALPTPALGRPVAGAVVRGFGTYKHERSGAVLSRRGLDFAAQRGAPVAAVADGTVRWAGAIRGLDLGVIVDHGGYTTVLAKLSTVAVQPGTTVHRGDAVGTAARTRVYLEVRVPISGGAGLPIDPTPLLAPLAP